MHFVLPRRDTVAPTVVDRRGRNLMAAGYDIISMAFSTGPLGDQVTLVVMGSGLHDHIMIPWRIVNGTHIGDTRLFDHHNVEVVNALRVQALTPCHTTQGECAYNMTIPLRADDKVEIGVSRSDYLPGFMQ